jgi:hypothetical protein
MNRAIREWGRLIREQGGPLHQASCLINIFIEAAKMTV